jgi:transposase-like protein
MNTPTVKNSLGRSYLYCFGTPIVAIKTPSASSPAIKTNHWIEKAHKVIAAECRKSYEHMNCLPNGQLRKKHVPYSVPELAEEMLRCIRENDEATAKSIFLRLALPPF